MEQQTPTPTITISEATEQDIPALGRINALAYSFEPITRFIFKTWPNESGLVKLLTLRLQSSFANPATKFLKAVDAETGELYGFICMRLDEADDGSGVAAGPNSTRVAMAAMMSELNVDFLMKTMPQFGHADEGFKNLKHYHISSFAVLPQHQGKGIGSSLMSHCLQIVDAAGLSARLEAFPSSHDLYERYGFEDREVMDVDLSQYSKPYCGWGVYRNTAMVRGARKTG